jgi:hypothetical protein
LRGRHTAALDLHRLCFLPPRRIFRCQAQIHGLQTLRVFILLSFCFPNKYGFCAAATQNPYLTNLHFRAFPAAKKKIARRIAEGNLVVYTGLLRFQAMKSMIF